MPTVDEVIAAYVKLRDKKAALEKETKEQVATIRGKMEKLEAWLKAEADTQGVTGFKATTGTAFLSTTDFAAVADWDAVVQWIKDNDAYDLLERRINKTAVRGYLDQNKCLPSGVNYGTKVEMNVRRPSSRA